MQGETTPHCSREPLAIHPLDAEDAAIAAAMRVGARSGKGVPLGVEARSQYDALTGSILARGDVKYEVGGCGGISGLWVLPADWRPDEVIIHLHGGWFIFGSAAGYGNLVAHIAARAKARTFIPDYRLAPEHPFPAATDDVLACYRGLSEIGVRRVALTGDSAGGNLALGLAARVANNKLGAKTTLLGVAVFSPVTDLTLSGESYETRAEADPLFTRAQVAVLVQAYLRGADPKQALASPLYGLLTGMPPVHVHVGDDEVLLDDSRSYVQRAVGVGVDAKLDVWLGMAHGFPGSVGKLRAAGQALDAVGAFLSGRLHA